MMTRKPKKLATPLSAQQRQAIQDQFWLQVASADQFRDVFDHLPGIYFFVKDRDSRLIAASSEIWQRFGLESANELVGTTDYDYFPPHIADCFVADDRQVIESNQPLIGRVEIWYTAERLLDWFVTNKFPVRDAAGLVIGVMGTIRSYEGQRDALRTYTLIDDVVDYIRQHHCRKITVGELAERVQLSTRQLHRRFFDAFGMSVQEFLIKTRIRAASAALLSTQQSIAEIACEFGFCDQSAFTQQFRKHVGVTPRQYRLKHSR